MSSASTLKQQSTVILGVGRMINSFPIPRTGFLELIFVTLLILPKALAIETVSSSVITSGASGLTHYSVLGSIGASVTSSMAFASILWAVVMGYLAPLMGITSVLWVTMRNDSAIPPEISWIIFEIWGTLTLIYLTIQTRRIAHGKLYILVTLTFAGLCMCVAAVMHSSNAQGGLVTAIPACISFSSYAVAFVFPNRRNSQGFGTENGDRAIEP